MNNFEWKSEHNRKKEDFSGERERESCSICNCCICFERCSQGNGDWCERSVVLTRRCDRERSKENTRVMQRWCECYIFMNLKRCERWKRLDVRWMECLSTDECVWVASGGHKSVRMNEKLTRKAVQMHVTGAVEWSKRVWSFQRMSSSSNEGRT